MVGGGGWCNVDMKRSCKGRNRRRNVLGTTANASVVTKSQRPKDWRTVAEDECDSREACARCGSCCVKKEDWCRVGPVGRSDYWRDRSARDEKSQSIVVARIRNKDASKGPSHSSASILIQFENSGLVFELDALDPSLPQCPLVPLLGTDVGKSKPTKSSTDV